MIISFHSFMTVNPFGITKMNSMNPQQDVIVNTMKENHCADNQSELGTFSERDERSMFHLPLSATDSLLRNILAIPLTHISAGQVDLSSMSVVVPSLAVCYPVLGHRLDISNRGVGIERIVWFTEYINQLPVRAESDHVIQNECS
jgi:hypothetical protein